MATNNNFQERRVENRRAYLEEKRTNEVKRQSYIQKVFAQCDKVQQTLGPFADEVKMSAEFVIYKAFKLSLHKLSGYKINENIPDEILDDSLKCIDELFTNIHLKDKMPPPGIIKHIGNRIGIDLGSEVLKYKKTEFKKFLKYYISDAERKMAGYLAMLTSSAGNLKKMINSPLYLIEDDVRKSFLGTLNQILSVAQIENHTEFLGLCEKIQDSLKGDFIKKSNEYKKAIQSFQPIAYKVIDAARSNIKLLDEELKFIENKKKGYFNSLEGLILEYHVYHIEGEKAQDDEEYSQFLYNKSEEKLSLLKSRSREDIKEALENLKEHRHISDNDVILLKATLEKELKIEEGGPQESFEDVQLKASVISDYGISPTESVRIAELVNYENIDRISRELFYKCEKELSDALIRDNPELFLLDVKETGRYIERLEESIELMRDYNEIDDFNPVKSPHNFSSFDALKEIRRKFYNLIGKIGVGAQKTGQEKQEINELDNIRLSMAREGFEPDIALAILRRGFYFGNQYFTGDHRINEKHLVRNTQRDKSVDFEERGFAKELNKLIRGGAVLYSRGYSLNDKTKEIKSEALKGAVAYVLTRHPLEEE